MQLFRTTFSLPKGNFDIHHQSNLILMGSCFSENIGDLLSHHQFHVQVNPFGIIYNPFSICKGLAQTIKRAQITESELAFHDGYYFHYDFHSNISNPSSLKLVEQLNNTITKAYEDLKKADILFITLGSAWYYKKDNKVVANCHKQPSKLFTKKVARVEEVVAEFGETLNALIDINPSLNVVFTVSPVRHLKDGVVENQRSKSILLESIHQLSDAYSFISYFPSYEIMMDDLRDYRFYSNDMLHPSSEAINYIWDHFQKVYFTQNTQEINREIKSLKKSLAHHPIKNESVDYHNFKLNLTAKIQKFQTQYPCIKRF